MKMNHARKSVVTKSLFIVQSVLLVSGIVIVGVLSYSAFMNPRGLQSRVDDLNSALNALEYNYSELESNFTGLYKNYSATLPPVTDSSYYIFKQNGTYFAKSGFTGNIENSSLNCSAVLEYALMHVPAYGTVFLKSLATDNDAYYIDSTIYMPIHTTLASENKMVTLSLKDNCNVDVIQLYNVFDTQIRNLRIYGNKENNKIGGNGIDINSNWAYDSKHTIEDVVIENCAMNGILVQNYPRDNTFKDVKVYYCNQSNVEIDSSDNTLIDVQSGWAGHSGFKVLGVDNYFTNCVSWGCGSSGDQNDCEGFEIKGVRNLFIGCDASANDGGGFVLDHADECMLTSCIGRDNGRRITGTWGFDLYDTKSTTLCGCLSTDENDQISKTQYYGFTEGGFSDYNLVTGCNLEGNKVGAVFALTGIHTVIRDTLGYSLVFQAGYFIYADNMIAVGNADTYGDVGNFTSPTGSITEFHVTIFVGGINETDNETATVRVQAYAGGNVTSLEIPMNAGGAYCMSPQEICGLFSNNSKINEVLVSASTNESATAATVKVTLWGNAG